MSWLFLLHPVATIEKLKKEKKKEQAIFFKVPDKTAFKKWQKPDEFINWIVIKINNFSQFWNNEKHVKR